MVSFIIFYFSYFKFRNAAFVVRSKYALSIHTKDLMEENLEELLDDPQYQENARKISQLFRDNINHPMETTLYWIDYVIRHKGAHHLKYDGKYFSLIEYYSLDIHGMILLMMLAIIIYSAKHLAPPNRRRAKTKRE